MNFLAQVKQWSLLLFFGILCTLPLSSIAQQVILDNKTVAAVSVSPVGYQTSPGTYDSHAQHFKTGTALSGQTISVDLVMGNASGTPSNFVVQIWGSDANGNPDVGNVLTTLSGNNHPAIAGTYTYTGTVSWTAGQDLFIVCSAVGGSSYYKWNNTNDAAITTTSGYTSLYRVDNVSGGYLGNTSDYRHLFSLTVPPPAPTTPEVYVKTPTQSPCGTSIVGNLSVPVHIKNADKVGAISLVFQFDDTELDYQPSFLLNPTVFTAGTPSPVVQHVQGSGEVRISWYNTTPLSLSSADVELFTLSLAKANGGNFVSATDKSYAFGWNTLVAGDCELANELGQVISGTTFTSGTFTVLSSPTVLLAGTGLIAPTGPFPYIFEGCSGTTVAITASGANLYTFKALPNGTILQAESSDNTFDYTGFQTGSILEVVGKNSNGCTATAQLTTSVYPAPTITLVSGEADGKVCLGSTITFTAGGASQYQFETVQNGTPTIVQAYNTTTTFTYTPTTTVTNIRVTGKSGLGCLGDQVTINNIQGETCQKIEGNLVYKNTAETPMGGVGLKLSILSTNPQVDYSTVSNSTGGFVLQSTASIPDGNYVVYYSTVNLIHGGINSTDALLVLLHTVGTAPLTGLELTAANVNNGAEGVNAADALSIANRFVKITPSYYAPDWVFDKTSYAFNATNTVYLNQKISMLAVGDVNGSYTPQSQVRGGAGIVLTEQGSLLVNNGDQVQIPVRADQSTNVGAMSLSFYFPSNAMTIQDVTLPNGQSLLFNVIGDEVRIAWMDLQALNLAANDVMFQFHATIQDAEALGAGIIGINAESEIANGQATVLENLILTIPVLSAATTGTNTVTANRLQVREFPNPLTTKATIEYQLSATSEVSLVITNLLGQEVVVLVNATQSAGTHQAVWNAEKQAAGTYFYRLTATENGQQYQKTGSLVLVK